MPFIDGYELIKYAHEQEGEQKLFLRWVSGYQTSISFADFKNKIKQASSFDKRTSEEILADVEMMMKNTIFNGEE